MALLTIETLVVTSDDIGSDRTRVRQDCVRSHHLVILVIENVAVPDIVIFSAGIAGYNIIRFEWIVKG